MVRSAFVVAMLCLLTACTSEVVAIVDHTTDAAPLPDVAIAAPLDASTDATRAEATPGPDAGADVATGPVDAGQDAAPDANVCGFAVCKQLTLAGSGNFPCLADRWTSYAGWACPAGADGGPLAQPPAIDVLYMGTSDMWPGCAVFCAK